MNHHLPHILLSAGDGFDQKNTLFFLCFMFSRPLLQNTRFVGFSTGLCVVLSIDK